MVETPDILRDPVSRRTFLARMSAAGLGTAAAALIAGCGGSSNNGSSSGTGSGLTSFADQANFPNIPGQNENIVVLNYALTLETLEADLYRQCLNIAAGQPLATPLPADGGASYTQAVGNGSLDPTLAPIGFLYLQQYAAVEAAHRDFLRTAIPSIGGTPVPPNPKGYTTGLSAGTDLGTILRFLRTVEEEGVRAYLGAAGFLTIPALVQAASTIYSTEARHSSGLNFVLGLDTGPQPGSSAPTSSDNTVTGSAYPSPNTFEYFKTPKEVLGDVKPFFVM